MLGSRSKKIATRHIGSKLSKGEKSNLDARRAKISGALEAIFGTQTVEIREEMRHVHFVVHLNSDEPVDCDQMSRAKSALGDLSYEIVDNRMHVRLPKVPEIDRSWWPFVLALLSFMIVMACDVALSLYFPGRHYAFYCPIIDVNGTCGTPVTT